MKKFLASMLFAGLFTVCLVGCGSPTSAPKKVEPPATTMGTTMPPPTAAPMTTKP